MSLSIEDDRETPEIERAYSREPLEGPIKGARTWKSWVRGHVWTTAACAFLVACCIVVVIVAPICATGHCGNKKTANADDTGPLTLIVRFTSAEIDALQVIPAILRQYTDRIHLNSSSLQILSFSEEDVLDEARKYLAAHPNIELLLRDFYMQVVPQQPLDDTLLQSILNVYAPGVYLPDAAQQASDLAAAQALLGNLTGSTGRRLNQALGTPVTPNDPYFSTQYFHQTVKTPSAWAASTGAPDIIVAIIDTGTDTSHPDLIPNLWVNSGEIPGNGIDDDGNGYIDDYYGYDFAGGCLNNKLNTQGYCIQCVGQPNPMPFLTRSTSPHGTHVAGLVGAVQNNAIGVTGTAPSVKIMSLKVDNCVASVGFSTASIVAAFDYAFRMGAHIVSCSFGPNIYNYNNPLGYANVTGTSWSDPQQAKYQAAYVSAIAPLATKGVLVVAAAGNEFTNLDHYTAMGFFYGPCNTPLPNIVCVGASDPSDVILGFSNYGNQTVHIASPGQSIFSTWLTATGQSYGTYTGTSQATPIVTGIAALVLATLSSADGVLFRAPQLKSIVMSSGVYSAGLAKVTVSGSRVDAAGAVQAAIRANSLLGLPTISPTTFAPAMASILLAGFSDTYYTTSKTGSFATAGLVVLDTSVRVGPSSSYPTFKYGAGTLLYSRAMLYLASAGVYNAQVTTTLSASNYQIAVAGLTVNVTNGLAVFSITTPGYFLYELYISAPIAPFTLNWKTPGFTTYTALNSFYVSTATVFTTPTFAQNLTLGSGYQIFYNSSTVALAPNVMFKTLSSSSSFNNTLIVPDLNFTAGAAKAALFPGGAPTNLAIGVASTTLKPRNWGLTGGVMFRLTCKGCSLTLNDLLVIDNWDSTVSGAVLNKTSGCINLTSWQQYSVVIQFATSDLTNSPLTLTTGSCAAGSVFAPLTRTTTPMYWQPASSTAGYIGGLQCDVWRNATFGVNGSAPTFKVRLPMAAGLAETLGDTTTLPFNFTLESILPGLSASYPASRGGIFTVRCWTYTSTVPGLAKLTAPVTGTTSSTIYLAGRKVGGTSLAAAGTAPPVTSQLAGYLQLLAIEWTAVTPLAPLALQLAGATVSINLATMLLPLQIVGQASGLIGTPGHYSVAYAPTGVDVPALVQTDMGEFIQAGYVTNNVYGLEMNASYSRTLRSISRYARTDGYFVLSLPYVANYTIQVSEIAMQSSAVMMGNVTVKNGPAFAGPNTLAATYTFQVYLPEHPGAVADDLYYSYMSMIVKSITPDGDANFDMDILLPADDAGAMNTQVWFRTASAPLN